VSKRSRTFQPPTTTGSASGATPAPADDGASTPIGNDAQKTPAPAPATQGSSSTTSRSAARRRASTAGRVSAPPSFFERYRALVIGAVAILVVAGTVAVVASMSTSSASAYECTTLLTPGPSDPVPTPRPVTPAPSVDPAASPAPVRTPEPQPTQRLGFTTQDLGKNHVGQGTKVDYAYCPPASGSHYNIGGRAPLTRQFYPPTTELGPGNWIHNLEHGYVVLLYRGEPSAEILQQLQDIMSEAVPTEASAVTCGYSKVIAARFDDMDPSVDFAAVAWDRQMLLEEFDKELLLTFANQWQDGPQTPEAGLC
jgi:hypothetical protein